MSNAYDWVPTSKRRSRNAPNQLLSCRTLKTEVQATMLDRCECTREVGVGEATAHRPVASADGLARRGGHGAVEAVAGCPRGALSLAGHEKMWQKKRLEKVVIFVSQGVGQPAILTPPRRLFAIGGQREPPRRLFAIGGQREDEHDARESRDAHRR